MRWLLGLVTLTGCHEIFQLQEHEPIPQPGDEDGDGVRNDRDLCPGIRDDQRDGDGDGVGDACDPAPSAAGDRIAAFYAFDVDDPAWVRTGGNWSIANGQLVMTSSERVIQGYFAKFAERLVPPYTVEARFAIDQLDLDSAFAVTANLDDTGNGAACALHHMGNGTTYVQGWWMGGSEVPVAPITPGESYRVRFTVTTPKTLCDMAGETAGRGGAVMRDMDVAREGFVGVEGFNDVAVRVDYLAIYD